jgi:hypothetical protein
MCALLLGAAGLFLNLLQLHWNGKQRRAEWLARLYGRYLEDDEMAEIFQLLEYNKFEYKEEGSFHDSVDERKLDKLLEHYETIAMVFDLGTIKDPELGSFRFQMRTVYENAQVGKYFEFLDKWFAAGKMPEAAFVRSRQLAKLIKEKFGDKAT